MQARALCRTVRARRARFVGGGAFGGFPAGGFGGASVQKGSLEAVTGSGAPTSIDPTSNIAPDDPISLYRSCLRWALKFYGRGPQSQAIWQATRSEFERFADLRSPKHIKERLHEGARRFGDFVAFHDIWRQGGVDEHYLHAQLATNWDGDKAKLPKFDEDATADAEEQERIASEWRKQIQMQSNLSEERLQQHAHLRQNLAEKKLATDAARRAQNRRKKLASLKKKAAKQQQARMDEARRLMDAAERRVLEE
ncbi:MAG: hypothetical protein MHM6MM_000106 [Cercozoa sp. M6MM]